MSNKKIITEQKIGTGKVQRSKELRRQMTEEEKILWEQLRANRLGDCHFRRQQVIDGFIVDFYCHKAGLVVEVDGPIHEEQAEYDLERARILTGRGLRTLRIKNEEIRQDLSSVLNHIEKCLHTELSKAKISDHECQ